MLKENKRLAAVGASLIPIRAKSKKPVDINWSSLRTESYDELLDHIKPGQNIGLRPGEFSYLVNGRHLHVLDTDIRDDRYTDDAHAALKSILPDYEDFPTIQSGSRGESRHTHFTTSKAFKSKKLFRSKQKIKIDGRTVEAWSIELYGTGKQTVIPPSVHPDTGKTYRWIKPYSDQDLQDIEDGYDVYFIPAKTVESWKGLSDQMAGDKRRSDRDDNDDLTKHIRQQPLGLSVEEIEDVLDDLPDEWNDDYELWLKEGAALNHERDGDEPGLDLWHWISKKSDKYDPDVLDDKWDSFKGSSNPVTLKTLIRAANKARKDRAFKEMDDADDSDLDDDEKPDREWRRALDVDSNGTMKSLPGNIKTVLENDDRVSHVLAYNDFLQNIVLIDDFKAVTPHMINYKCTDKINGVRWPDECDDNMRIFLETRRKYKGYGAKITDRDLAAGIRTAAQSNRFHPVKEHIEREKWDGKERIDTLFHDFLGCDDNSYTREASRLIMIGAVTRIYEPGCKFDFVPILEGGQGVRKTTFVKVLSCGWFNNLHPNFHDDKKMVESMLGYWILELPELAGFARSDIKSIKQFVTTQADVTRLSYDRRARDFKRQCVFIGTTNDEQYLADDTGNRRYWPIKVKVREIDTDRLQRIIGQYWAEALHKYRRMREEQPHGVLPLYIRDPDALKLAGLEQELREELTTADYYAEKIEGYLAGEGDARLNDLDGRAPPDQINAAMKKIDYFKFVGSRRMADGKKRKVWRRVGYEPQHGGDRHSRAFKDHKRLI